MIDWFSLYNFGNKCLFIVIIVIDLRINRGVDLSPLFDWDQFSIHYDANNIYNNKQENNAGTLSQTVFHRNSNSMEISFHSHLDSDIVIATLYIHGTAAMLSWYAQTYAAKWWPATELQACGVSIQFELRAKIISETG